MKNSRHHIATSMLAFYLFMMLLMAMPSVSIAGFEIKKICPNKISTQLVVNPSAQIQNPDNSDTTEQHTDDAAGIEMCNSANTYLPVNADFVVSIPILINNPNQSNYIYMSPDLSRFVDPPQLV